MRNQFFGFAAYAERVIGRGSLVATDSLNEAHPLGKSRNGLANGAPVSPLGHARRLRRLRLADDVPQRHELRLQRFEVRLGHLA
jgi:hypothetical protein